MSEAGQNEKRPSSALIVGASSGMGRATALSLTAAGWHVVASARRLDRLEDLQQQCRDLQGTLTPVACDAANGEQVRHSIAEADERCGGIDLLVYATGTNIPNRAMSTLSESDWRMMLDTNLHGAFLYTQAVLPLMRRDGGGLIVYLSSAAVQMPDVSGAAYQASKHGLTGLAHAVRIEEKSAGIRTSVIYPGLCDTEILTKRPTPTPRDVLDQALDPQDVADAVLFLANLPARAVVPEMQLLPSRL